MQREIIPIETTITTIFTNAHVHKMFVLLKKEVTTPQRKITKPALKG